MVQYFVVMLFARVKGKAMLPLALHSLVMGIAGGIYLGVGSCPVLSKGVARLMADADIYP